MGNKSSSEGNRIPRSPSGGGTTLTSAEDLEAWLPDSIEKLKSGTLPPNRDVDWEDERVVMKETQLNTIHNLVEEQKTLKRSASFAGKLANMSIGKVRGKSKRDLKKGLTRSVSFHHNEREEVTFEDCDDRADSSEDTTCEDE
jgi:hypothetical protein